MSAQFESGPRNADEISGCGSDGGTLTARSVVITTGVTYRRLGVPAPAVRQKALTSPAAGSASRGGRDDGRSSRTAARPEPARWPPPRTSRSIAAGSLAGTAGRC